MNFSTDTKPYFMSLSALPCTWLRPSAHNMQVRKILVHDSTVSVFARQEVKTYALQTNMTTGEPNTRPHQYCSWSFGDVTSCRKSAMPLRSGRANPTRLKNGITWAAAYTQPCQLRSPAWPQSLVLVVKCVSALHAMQQWPDIAKQRSSRIAA